MKQRRRTTGLKYSILGVPVHFSMDGTWEVSIENPILEQGGSLFLVVALKAVVLAEKLTGLTLPVSVSAFGDPAVSTVQ